MNRSWWAVSVGRHASMVPRKAAFLKNQSRQRVGGRLEWPFHARLQVRMVRDDEAITAAGNIRYCVHRLARIWHRLAIAAALCQGTRGESGHFRLVDVIL